MSKDPTFSMLTAKMLVGVGIVGKLLLEKEQPLPILQSALHAQGFSANEATMVLNYILICPIHIPTRTKGLVSYWSLVGERHSAWYTT